MKHRYQSGFTLVEMIVVIVITGIIGGIVAVFIRMPVQGYTDSARRAEMTDIADTALRRMSRDIRTALPNSVRVSVIGTATYLEFLPTKGSGRYRADAAPSGASVGCGSLALDVLNFAATDTCFEVLGPMPVLAAGDRVAIYNRGIAGVDAYAGDNTGVYSASAATTITISPAKQYPFKSPGNRFQVIDTPVTYVCAPVAGGVGGTLTRYWGYAIQDVKTKTDSVAELDALVAVQGARARLANRVSACSLSYDAVGQRLALVTLQLTLADSGESVTLYSSTHVSNVP